MYKLIYLFVGDLRFWVEDRKRITRRLLLCWTQENHGWRIIITRGDRSLMTSQSKYRLVRLSNCIGYERLRKLLKIVLSWYLLLEQWTYTLLNNGDDIWFFIEHARYEGIFPNTPICLLQLTELFSSTSFSITASYDAYGALFFSLGT
jgi:hypothetical protein